ncbi:MAG: geranylgeranyl reductase family protein [Candidatus Hodarchaeales archaeon]
MPDKDIYDIVIVGGGPSGTSAAYHASKHGLRVLLLEKETYPRDKPCGGALSTRTLDLLGDEAKKSINSTIQETRIVSPSLKNFVVDDISGNFVVREIFDQAMAIDAKKVGAEIFEDTTVDNINVSNDGIYEIETTKGNYRSKYLILANGVRNDVLVRKMGIRNRWPDRYLATTVVSETPINLSELKSRVTIDKATLVIFFGVVPRGYGWLFVKDGFLNIGIGATAEDLEGKSSKKVYNEFINLLYSKNYIPKDLVLTKAKGHRLVFRKPAKKTVFDNLLLVGDVAGFVSPVTGEGLYYGIKSGQLAVEAIIRSIKTCKPPQDYSKEWKKDFGTDLSRYGLFLQNKLYKSQRRLEWVVAIGRHDRIMAKRIVRMVYGIDSYKHFILFFLFRLPITLLKIIL